MLLPTRFLVSGHAGGGLYNTKPINSLFFNDLARVWSFLAYCFFMIGMSFLSFFSPSHLMLYDESISLSDNYDIWQWHYPVFVLCRFFSFTWQIPSSFFKIVCYLTNAVFVFITLGSVRPIFRSQEFVINSKPLLNIRSCISDQQSHCSSCSDTQLQWLFWEVPQWFLTVVHALKFQTP